MVRKTLKWFRTHYFLIVHSIAFYPIIITFCLLLLALGLVQLDYSSFGNEIKSQAEWLKLRDGDTARTIIATVAAGILSLAVFSFSMVMILLNQAASNMSNRILDGMIGNRFHQMVLGFYIGTIVYAFFLLSTIRDNDAIQYIPSLSIFVLILFTITDIFLFIYFLHYITRSVKYETIINNIHKITTDTLHRYYPNDIISEPVLTDNQLQYTTFLARQSGYFNGLAEKSTLNFCEDNDLRLQFLQPEGTYILQDTPVMIISSKEPVNDEIMNRLDSLVDIVSAQQNISENAYLGCRHLAEVAIKALSPGINDPGTAIISLNCLADLLAYRMKHHPETTLTDEKGTVRIILHPYSFKDFFTGTVYPIWDYGKNDRMVQEAMYKVVTQLLAIQCSEEDKSLLEDFFATVKAQKSPAS